MRCEWAEQEKCTSAATHTVHITFPGQPKEIWNVCRVHDRVIKNLAVARRTPRPQDSEPTSGPNVHCAQCDRALHEPVSADESKREPCPHCGCTARIIRVTLTETISVHEGFRVRQRCEGKGGWVRDVKSGDDFTYALQAWGQRTLDLDRARDVYREVIRLYDGTEIESSARLSDHRD
jgi:hypothetical protein